MSAIVLDRVVLAGEDRYHQPLTRYDELLLIADAGRPHDFLTRRQLADPPLIAVADAGAVVGNPGVRYVRSGIPTPRGLPAGLATGLRASTESRSWRGHEPSV